MQSAAACHFFGALERCGPMRGQIHAMYSLGPPLLENLLVGRGMTRYTAIWHSPYDNTIHPPPSTAKVTVKENIKCSCKAPNPLCIWKV